MTVNIRTVLDKALTDHLRLSGDLHNILHRGTVSKKELLAVQDAWHNLICSVEPIILMLEKHERERREANGDR